MCNTLIIQPLEEFNYQCVCQCIRI